MKHLDNGIQKSGLINNRIKWIDISKGIAILTVIIGHVKSIPWEPWRKIIFSFHMPLFFIVAGYTASANLSWKNIKKYANRLLGPYLFASVLVSIVRMLQGSNLLTELRRMLWGSGVPADYGPGIPVTGTTNIPVAGAIWFLPCLFFARTIFSTCLNITKSKKEWIRTILIFSLCISGYILGQHYKVPLCIDLSLFCCIFLYTGYLLKKYNCNMKKSVTLGAALVMIWYIALRFNALELAARFYREFPFCIFTTAGAIAACLLIFYISDEIICKIKGVNEFLIYCGKYSLPLLLIHHFDGTVWKYYWFTWWLPDYSGLSEIKQGCVIALYKIMSYLIVLVIYVFTKKIIQKVIPKDKE